MSPHDYECIDPTLGVEIELLEMEGLDPELRERLLQHVRICHACREKQALGRITGEMIAAGEIGEASPVDARARFLALSTRRTWLAAGLAALLAFILALALPPSPGFRADFLRRSGADDFRFTRPLEGESLIGAGGRLAWTPVTGAEGYRVTIERADGAYRWTGETAASVLELPADCSAPGSYIAAVETRPADLLLAGEGSVSFRRGTWPAWLAFRMAHPSLLSLGCMLVAVGQLVFALTRRK